MTVSDGAVPRGVSGSAGRLARWGLRARLRDVVIAELVAVALVADLPWVGWPVAAPIVVVVLATATLTYHGATAAGWARRAGRFWWYRRSRRPGARRAHIPEPFSVELAGIGAVGMRWDGQYAVTMIALHGRAYAPTVLTPAGAETIDTVPLAVVASLLRQFGGLELDSVDVVSVGRRTAEGGRYTPRYDEIVGDRPAVGLRQSWLVLRLCPRVCLAAMAYRGDAAAASTERIRQALLRSGCRAVVCSAEQIKAATEALLAGDELAEMSESWSRLDGGRDFVTSYRVAGADLTTRLINDIWVVRSNATVTTVRVAPGRPALRRWPRWCGFTPLSR